MTPSNNLDNKNHWVGHRQRLRKRILDHGAEQCPDYEILEALLFYAIPRVDLKPVAKALLERFSSISQILSATPEQLADIIKAKEPLLCLLALTRDIGRRMSLQQVQNHPVISSWQALIAYCRTTISHSGVEQLRLLFLDTKNRLILDELHHTGTIDQTVVYPREIIKRALNLNAAGLIMVHNHPSGKVTPSPQDITTTRQIEDITNLLNLQLQDHIIIGPANHFSMRSEGIIGHTS